jgi:hypothetical protein
MRHIRVRAENGERLAGELRAAGYHARWLGPGTAYTSLWGGCSDPNCCDQHDCYYRPSEWGLIKTSASGTQAHKVWSQIGG